MGGLDVYAWRCVVGGGNTHVGKREQVHVAIDAAEDGEIAGQGRDVFEMGIVHADGDDIVARVDGTGDVKAERREIPAMLADECSVYIYIGDGRGGIEAQEIILTAGNTQVGAIPPRPAVIIVPAVLAVVIVPGVGEIELLPVGIVKAGRLGPGHVHADKAPILIDEAIGVSAAADKTDGVAIGISRGAGASSEQTKCNKGCNERQKVLVGHRIGYDGLARCKLQSGAASPEDKCRE